MYQHLYIITELAKRSLITMQNSSNPSSQKNLGVRPYDRPCKVLLLTCLVNCTAGTANVTASFSSLVVSALGSESDNPGSSPGRGKVRRAGK